MIKGAWQFLNSAKYGAFPKVILNSYSEIFFLSNPWTGLLLFLAVTIAKPSMSAAGLMCALSAYIFARFIGMKEEFLHSGFYTYNAILVGLSIGFICRITPLSILLLVCLGVMTFLVTGLLFNLFYSYLKLPVLSLPFVIVSSIAYLASSKYSVLVVSTFHSHTISNYGLNIPIWIEGYFRALGAIFFLPHLWVGIAFATTIFISSPILFLLSLLGYYSGVLMTGLMTGAFNNAFTDITHFNHILTAMAIGGVFMASSPKSYLLSIIAVFTCTVLLDSIRTLWATYAIPVFTLPFNLVTMTFIYMLGIVSHPMMVRYIQATPEATLDHFLTNSKRFTGKAVTLSLPFTGEWEVWQGFDGEWTHQGYGNHACDFLIRDGGGKSHNRDGKRLEDYYAFRKPVLSPISGQVVKIVNNLKDNLIGQVDRENNWGNLVILREERGFFIELSHFLQNSIKVNEGDRVVKGHILGLCGNSGNSPQPHIHIQVQELKNIGAQTLPFSFSCYESKGRYYANNVPGKDDTVSPIKVNDKLERKTSFIPGDEYEYDVFRTNRIIERLSFKVKTASDGTCYLDSGRGKMYFGKLEGTFYFYRVTGKDPWLKYMMIAAARLPLCYKENLEWEDFIPSELLSGKTGNTINLLLGSFYHKKLSNRVNYVFMNENSIEGTITSSTGKILKKTVMELDESKGFKYIRVGDIELKRDTL